MKGWGRERDEGGKEGDRFYLFVIRSREVQHLEFS